MFFEVDFISATADQCDPDDWNYFSATDTNAWIAVIVAFDLYIAIANEGSTGQDTAHLIMTSPDGETWTERATTTSGGLNADEWTDLAFNGSRVCGCSTDGSDGRIIYSDDGITWNYTTDADTSRTAWNAIGAGEGRFIAVGVLNSGADTIYSDNGGDNTWTHLNSGIESGVVWNDIAHNGVDTWVSVGSHASPSGKTLIRYSTNNGVTWTGTTTGVPENAWQACCWSETFGVFIAVSNTGTNNRFIKSTDGITWSTAGTSVNDDWRDVVEAEGTVVVIGDTDVIAISFDLSTWDTRSAPGDQDWEGLAFMTDVGFVAVSTNHDVVNAPFDVSRVMKAVC